MEKSKKSKILFGMLIAFAFILVSCLSVVTYAWFTDSKTYTGTLNFGEIQLLVKDSSSAEMSDGATLPFTLSRSGASKAMPGDTITINLNVGLKTGSDDSYYFVVISDTKNVFKKGAYFLNDAGEVCYYDATAQKAYKQGTTTEVSQKIGKVTVSSPDTLAIQAQILSTVTDQSIKSTAVTCKVVAIQQANVANDAAAIAAIQSSFSGIFA